MKAEGQTHKIYKWQLPLLQEEKGAYSILEFRFFLLIIDRNVSCKPTNKLPLIMLNIFVETVISNSFFFFHLCFDN